MCDHRTQNRTNFYFILTNDAEFVFGISRMAAMLLRLFLIYGKSLTHVKTVKILQMIRLTESQITPQQ